MQAGRFRREPPESLDALLFWVGLALPFVVWVSLDQRQWSWAAGATGALLMVLAYGAYRIHRSIADHRAAQRRRDIADAPIPPETGLAILRAARLYAEPGTRFGVAATIPDEARAFAGALAAGPRILPEARRLVVEGTPAGRVYGARLVATFDPAAADATWRRLQDDPDTLVWARGGCTSQERAVARIADWHVRYGDRPSGHPDEAPQADAP